MFAGIDWGGQRHQLAIVGPAGESLLNRSFPHNPAGLSDLVGELGQHKNGRPTPVAIERSEGILVELLHKHGHDVYPVSPRVSARARERYQAAVRKDDRFDAYVLADTLRLDIHRWRPLPVESADLAELRVLVRDRRRTLGIQQAVEAQLRAALDAYHPAAARLFSSVDRAITLAFVRAYPTPAAASRVGPERMQRFLARNGYTGRVPAAVLVERLKGSLMESGPGSTCGHSHGTLVLVEQLELLNRQLKAFEARIAEVFPRHPDSGIFSSFPAAGPTIAPALLAEIGEDRRRFPTVATLLAEAGLAPVTLASGKVTRVRFRRACNTRLRDTFNWWSYTLKRVDPATRSSYLAALDRGQHSHRALRGVGSRWARVLWRCWQDGVPYSAERHRKR
ncbi:MAG: IS110 family transposase [Actinomycetota bacterium]|nr:IS110 family transposase [Actinomycetota bacterium]